jgi:hypothetical protein
MINRNTTRSGAWVSTSTAIAGAHTDPAGRAVGIYQRGGLQQVPGISADGTAQPTLISVPEHVVFVRPDGTNLTGINAGGEFIPAVCVAPDQLEDLRLVPVADHCPPDRVKHLPKGTKLVLAPGEPMLAT